MFQVPKRQGITMSAWLRNLQGQLSELASEVLSEATEEVEDPGSELQVSINFLVFS